MDKSYRLPEIKRKKRLYCAPCSSSPPRRNIVATGMKRFEGIDKKSPPQPSVQKLSPRVVNILGMNANGYTLNGTNCYLVGTGKQRILLDTGDAAEMRPKEGSKERLSSLNPHTQFIQNLKTALKQEQCCISLIVISHLHLDHFGGCEGLLETFGPDIPVAMLPPPRHQLPIWTMQQLEKRGLIPFLERGPKVFAEGEPFDFEKWMQFRNSTPDSALEDWGEDSRGPVVPWDIAGRTRVQMQCDFRFIRHHMKFHRAWSDPTDHSVQGRVLHHGQVLRVEGATLRVVFTPGHSENHLSLVLEEERAIFSGDHVLGYGTTMIAELYDYMASLQAMQRFAPVRLYPGHGAFIADGKGLLDRYYEHRQARERQVVSFLRSMPSPRTAMQIALALYTSTPKERIAQARNNIEKILLKLFREGKCQCWKMSVIGSKSVRVPGKLPKYGYVQYMDRELTWELKAATSPHASARHERFVSIIYKAMYPEGEHELNKVRNFTPENIVAAVQLNAVISNL